MKLIVKNNFETPEKLLDFLIQFSDNVLNLFKDRQIKSEIN
jgi:hypothetical protein